MKVTKIDLDEESRMLRVGFGFHTPYREICVMDVVSTIKGEKKFFFRVDLWFVGYRITKN